MSGRHAGPPIGSQAREATAPPYHGRHRAPEDEDEAVREAEEAFADLMFAADPSIRPAGWSPEERAGRVADERWSDPEHDPDHQEDPDEPA